MKHFRTLWLIGVALCVTLTACKSVQNSRKRISFEPRERAVEAVKPKDEGKKIEVTESEPESEKRTVKVKKEKPKPKQEEPEVRDLAAEVMRAVKEANRRRIESVGNNTGTEEGNSGGSISLSDYSDAISENDVTVNIPIANTFGTAAVTRDGTGQSAPIPIPSVRVVQTAPADSVKTEASPEKDTPSDSAVAAQEDAEQRVPAPVPSVKVGPQTAPADSAKAEASPEEDTSSEPGKKSEEKKKEE